MYLIAASALTAFFLCFLLTPIVRNVFLRARIVDHPDSHRKSHSKATPRVGGIAIAIAYAVTLALAFFFHPHGIALFAQHRSIFLAILPATALIFLTGLLDDLFTLAPRQKLLGQSLAAALAVSLGARVPLNHGMGWFPILLSFLWLLLCTNAFNLIDGMDGLAAGIGLFASVSTAVVALLDGNLPLALAAIPLAACLLAFLRYNFPPATIFLGDCGSLTLGFLLGSLGLLWSHRSTSAVGMLAPVIALALPLADVLLTIGRRRLKGVPIFTGDSGHIHHMLRARMGKRNNAVLTLYAACAVASLFAVTLSLAPSQFNAPIAILFCLLAALAINRLGYLEFSAVRRSLVLPSLPIIRDEIRLLTIHKALDAATTLEALWAVAVESAESLNFASLHVTLPGTDLFKTMKSELPGADQSMWSLSVPLGSTGELTVTATAHPTSCHRALSFVEILSKAVARHEHTSAIVLDEEDLVPLSLSEAT